MNSSDALFKNIHLLACEAEEASFKPEVMGTIPTSIEGTLYRNGPGSFGRGNFRRTNLLDGDGFIQSLKFIDGQVDYQSKFVRTTKFIEEEKANKALYSTWSSVVDSYNPLKRLNIKCQAGVSVHGAAERLFAFDDFGFPYEIDKKNLATKNELMPKDKSASSIFAHSKIDGESKEWTLFGLEYGFRTKLCLWRLDKDLRQLSFTKYPLPKAVYFHDLWVTKKHIIFYLHPLNMRGMLGALGIKPIIDTFKWEPENGGKLWVIDKSDLSKINEIEVPAIYMWHAANAYEANDKIIADFIGYKSPGHCFSQSAWLNKIMTGEIGGPSDEGKFYRFEIDVKKRQANLNILYDSSLEFPTINNDVCAHLHRYVYMCEGPKALAPFHSGVCRLDTKTGATSNFDFGPGFFCGEPIFIKDKNRPNDEDSGHIISLVLDGANKRSFFALFDAKDLSNGPIAKINLETAMPVSFHGCFV